MAAGAREKSSERRSQFHGRPARVLDWRQPPGAPGYTGDDLVADAGGLLDALVGSPAHVVGFSMGGAIAQLVELDYLALGFGHVAAGLRADPAPHSLAAALR